MNIKFERNDKKCEAAVQYNHNASKRVECHGWGDSEELVSKKRKQGWHITKKNSIETLNFSDNYKKHKKRNWSNLKTDIMWFSTSRLWDDGGHKNEIFEERV